MYRGEPWRFRKASPSPSAEQETKAIGEETGEKRFAVQSCCRWSPAIAGRIAVLRAGKTLADATITGADWDRRTPTVRGSGDRRDGVTGENSDDDQQVIGRSEVGGRGSWQVGHYRINPAPCAVAAYAQGQQPVILYVNNAAAHLGLARGPRYPQAETANLRADLRCRPPSPL